ncbi:hypothetical protein SLS58_005211 [Diplodia intermedia]|uniref:NADH dehydrogenase [ubiquinone] 1 beta subcomplex subunit 4 n=1 Tax=Diplodia intermedia TaxID=856260 RepID=A0ABR3TRJ5_9PEZI
MAGDHHVLHEDPALVKYSIYIDDPTDVGPNRYKYFRWTPRTAWISFWVAIAVPSVVGLVAYNTDLVPGKRKTISLGSQGQWKKWLSPEYNGKYDLRGKRRGDVIKEF